MRNVLYAMALTLMACASFHTALAQQPVLQRGYDPGVTGADLTETSLNTFNVNPSTFGLVFNLPVDDKIYAQPLYVPQVTIPNKGIHNVLYVATMSDSLYAFDADYGGAPLWSVNFATSVGALPVSIAKFTLGGNTNITGNLGILSTPVIDPSTNIMYLVACTLENGTMVYRLHAVNIAQGTEAYPNVVISGSYNGVTFNAVHQTQRVSLTLADNQVVIAFGAIQAEDQLENGYSGWVMAYNKQTLVQSGSFASVTTGTSLGGGVWQSGRPPVVDSAGFVYVYTGNAYQGNGYNGETNFSESVVRLDPSDGMALVDWFTPSTWRSMDASDADLSSAGPLLVPNTSPSLLAGGGKTGVFFALNTSDLGQNTASDSGVVQEYTMGAGSLRGGPVYWQRSAANGGPLLYDWASSDSVKAFAFNGKTFASTATYAGSTSQAYPGGILALSANGQQSGTGVLWATVATAGNVFNDTTDPGALYAFDAGNVATQLYSSNTNASRDSFGSFGKFVPPMVANGKVYVATFSNKVAVYGILSPSTQVAAPPAFSPAPGTYIGTQLVTLSDVTNGAVIYYTTNGTTPTTASAQYVPGTSISVSASETIQAIAVASGYTTSAVASGPYTISAPGAGPVSVALSTVDNIYGLGTVGTATSNGGLDGRGDEYAAALLGTSITWSGATFTVGGANVADMLSSTTIPLPSGSYTTLKMLATGFNGAQNGTFVVTYTDGTTTTINQTLSDWYTPQKNPIGESIVTSMGYRILSNGTADNRTFNLYGYSFALNSAKSVQSLTLPNNRNVVVLAIDLVPASVSAPAAATPTFNPAPGSYIGTQPVALSDVTSGAVIYYTTNGTTPTTASAQYVLGSPIPVSASEMIEAIAVASGYSASAVTIGSYTISPQPVAGTPTFSPAPGTYTGTQPVTLSDTTSGAVIYYTTNGTTPTMSGSAQYVPGTPISVSATQTIQAIAVANGYTTSALASGTYTISAQPTVATPTFNPAPGSYTGTQPVTLSDATGGALIYYTTNGTTPTTASAQYVPGTPISVNATETISAIAVASGYTTSAVASGSYTISASGSTGTGPVSVGLSPTVDNIYGLGTVGTATRNGGLDGRGDDYAAALLGTSITWSGATFTIGGANVADMVSSATIALPSGSYTTLKILGTGFNGAQNGTFVVTYSDGTTTTINQTLSDWYTPQRNLAGESIVTSMAYRILPNGTADNRTFNLYGYSFALNSAKTVTSLTLPNNRNVVVLAIDLVSASGSLPVAATPTFSPAPGTYTGTQPVTLSDATSTAVIYYTTNGTTPTITSAQYVAGTPIAVSATETIQAIAVASGYTTSALASGTFTISALPTAATPTFSPAPGAYTGTQPVTLADATSGAVIYYTTDGTTPTSASAQYVPGTPISVSATETITAIAVASGYTTSAPASGTFTISALPTAATPTFSPAPGAYTGTQPVTLSDATGGAAIYYTTDGTTPTSASAQYVPGTPIAVSATETITAIAVASGYTTSVPASGTYTISALPIAATPTFSPAPGSYTGTQPVTLSDATGGALIYYTTNGTTPTTASAQYVPGTPISVNATETITAIAVASGYTTSAVTSGSYTISASGTSGTGPVNVTLSTVDNIYGLGTVGTATRNGGLDGRGDDYAAALLGTSITWSGATFTIGGANVADMVSSATIALPSGSYTTLKILGTGFNGAQNGTFVVTYSDGTTTTINQTLSDWYTPQRNLAGESIVTSMAYRILPNGTADNRTFNLYGYSFALNSAKTVTSLTLPNNRNVVVLAIDLVSASGSLPVAATPTFSPAPGTYTGTQPVTLSDATSTAVIYYTTNGTTPTITSAQYVAGTPIAVSATETIQAIAVASGYTTSALASGTFTISALPTAATPTFSPAPGAYTGTQPVTLADATGGAAIYYTTDGTTPTTASLQYVPGTPLAVSATETITAIAVASGYTTSAPASGTFTISALPTAATPTFSPAPGAYTGTQPVTLSDATGGAAIYYTTDGTTPTSASAQYVPGTPIAVSATETITAIAVASGYTTSVPASGTYTISALPIAATPTFSPAPGSYTGTQPVTLSDATGGALIYYTTDGTTPTTASAQYVPGTPISVSATETITAIAVASGYTTSAPAGGIYTISAQPVGGTPTLTSSQTSANTTANITTEGALDWVHWGDSALNRKSGVTAQLSTYSVVGSSGVNTYGNDPRGISWSDGTPTATATADTNGVYIAGTGNGFSFTAPASTTTQVLTVHVGGYNGGGTLTASLGDGSAPNVVSTTATVSGQYDANYTLTYTAGSNTTLTVTWIMSSGTGNVTLNAAALSY